MLLFKYNLLSVIIYIMSTVLRPWFGTSGVIVQDQDDERKQWMVGISAWELFSGDKSNNNKNKPPCSVTQKSDQIVKQLEYCWE